MSWIEEMSMMSSERLLGLLYGWDTRLSVLACEELKKRGVKIESPQPPWMNGE